MQNKVCFKDEKPVAIDIAKILGYDNPSLAVSELKPRYTRVLKMGTIDGKLIDVRVLEEEGINQLISGSYSPIAEELKDWLYNKVFPFLYSR